MRHAPVAAAPRRRRRAPSRATRRGCRRRASAPSAPAAAPSRATSSSATARRCRASRRPRRELGADGLDALVAARALLGEGVAHPGPCGRMGGGDDRRRARGGIGLDRGAATAPGRPRPAPAARSFLPRRSSGESQLRLRAARQIRRCRAAARSGIDGDDRRQRRERGGQLGRRHPGRDRRGDQDQRRRRARRPQRRAFAAGRRHDRAHAGEPEARGAGRIADETTALTGLPSCCALQYSP